ncbi:hypothetical protein CQW23_11293 [Capsicum baccatum]|uniref:D-isomer specific 2-hydroxyacid dehydrogenase catalytic domain-containing protein n=1 Tax=Capsicum baccatum TaxID=33114 RepID=A0A2G2WPC0_CAPBA|nr:hypothetical protein CQW23_11293 [Capsicum baccatum]
MEEIGVLLMRPLSNYLQQELSKRFTLFKYWEIQYESLKLHADSIRAVGGSGGLGADAALIDMLPRLEIVSSHSSGLDKIDLVKCKERGIRVTYTPDVVTDDVADMAILLIIATLRRICEADRFVRNGMWKQKDFSLTTKSSHFMNQCVTSLKDYILLKHHFKPLQPFVASVQNNVSFLKH